MAGGFSAAPNNQDRQAALAVAMEFERASKLARRGELVEAQAREVLKDIMKRADMGETIANRVHQIPFRRLACQQERAEGGKHRGTLRRGRGRFFEVAGQSRQPAPYQPDGGGRGTLLG